MVLTAARVGGAPLAPGATVDQLAFNSLKKLSIQPTRLCTHVVFARRAYLDGIGPLPTAQEVSQLLQGRDPDERRALIDRLLERDEFADYWP